MIENRGAQYAILGAAVVVLVLIVGWRMFSHKPPPPTPEELVQIALSSAAEGEREKAVVELARHPDEPVAELRTVFRQTNSPRVRAAAIRGLGMLRDWESIPELIEIMRTEPEFLRGRAAEAVNRIACEDLLYRANDPEQKRLRAIERIEEKWPLLYKGYQAKANAAKIRAEFERVRNNPEKGVIQTVEGTENQ